MANDKVKIKRGLPTDGTLTKKAVKAFMETGPSIKKFYAQNKAAIGKDLPWSPKIYNNALSIMYAVVKAPDSFFKRAFGTVPGMALSYAYGIVVAPLRTLLGALDLRTYKNFMSTIFYFFTDCLPNSLTNLFTKMFETLSDYFETIMKGSRASKSLKRLVSKNMLLESKAIHLESRIWDWVKGKLSAIAAKVKSAVWWFLKKGLSVIEKPFMAVVQPFAECMSRINKMGGNAGLMKSLVSSKSVGSLVRFLGGGALVASSGTLALGAGFGMLVTVMGYTAVVFSIAGYLNMVGQAIEFKNMIMDIF